MIHFVGAGPGAVDLITVRGQRYLKEADVIIYAGSLVNKGLLEYAKEGCEVYNSAYMTLEEVIEVMIKSEKEDKMTVRLHTGDLVFTVQSVSRWTFLMKKELIMIPALESAHFVERRQH